MDFDFYWKLQSLGINFWMLSRGGDGDLLTEFFSLPIFNWECQSFRMCCFRVIFITETESCVMQI